MFVVNEILVLSKDSSMPNSLVVEVCGNYAKELEGFYVLLPKTSHEAVKAYIKTIPQNSFILRTFDDNAINGLSLLLNFERGKSYTEEFIKIYGGIPNLLASFEKQLEPDTKVTNTDSVDSFIDTSIFSDNINPVDSDYSVYDEPPTEILYAQEPVQSVEEPVSPTVNDNTSTEPKLQFRVFEDTTSTEPVESISEKDNEDIQSASAERNYEQQCTNYDYNTSAGYTQYYSPQQVCDDYVNIQQGYDPNYQNNQQMYNTNYGVNQQPYNYAQSYYGSYTSMPVPYEVYRQQEEFYSLLQSIANLLGVNNYNTQTLEKSDMYNAQLAINSLDANLVKNAFIGALGLAESKNDMNSITRFLELFYTYLYETGLQ